MKLTPILKFIVCFAFVLGAILFSQKGSGQTNVSRATVTAILEGNQVFIQEKQAKIKDVAQRNQQVRTGSARAELTFDNKAVARLSRNTRFTVGECGVQLQQGTALISGTSGCTQGVTAAVRGTTYVLTVNENGTEEYQVLEGSVDFGKTDPNDPHKWTMDGGDQCILEPDRKGVIRSKITRGEYTRRLRGWAFQGFDTDPSRIERLRTTYARLFPNTRFPLRRSRLPNRGQFSLSVKQDRPQIKEVIVRLSRQRKRLNTYLPEVFVGDFVFPLNRKAQFAGLIEPFDRYSVRLFDRQNRFLGYTEFEGLDDNAAVSIFLPDDPSLYGTIRTFLGEDSDQDGNVDSDAFTYDFISQVKIAEPKEKIEVVFPKDLTDINRSSFTVATIPAISETPEFPDGFYEPLFSPLNRTTFPFRSGLAAPLLAVPGKVNPLVPIKSDGSSKFNIPREILKYRMP